MRDQVINLTLPIFEGGLNSIKVEKNEVELLNLKLQYNEIKNLIIKNIDKIMIHTRKIFWKNFLFKKSFRVCKKEFWINSRKI